MRLVPFGGAVAIFAFAAALDGCAHLTYPSGTAGVTPTPSPSGSASAAPCNTTGATGVQTIAITPQVSPTTAAGYGVINGYGLVVSGTIPAVASPINLLPSDSVQFYNNDTATTYSAVGIPNVTSFPGPTFTFPPSAINQSGTQINATANWSTGLLSPGCFSQTLTLAGAGTYFFGDYNDYALANFRNVIVVSTSAPQAAHRAR